MDFNGSSPFPEGVISFLDTDLYKLTMQCAVLRHFSDVKVTYAFHNRTPEKKLSRAAFRWLQIQINKLGNIALSNDELRFLQNTCTYLNKPYLDFLKEFRLNPRDQIEASFTPEKDTGSEDDIGEFYLTIKGLWVETILYEIPLLALTSEAYFRFMDTDWTYDGQEDKAYAKEGVLGIALTDTFGTPVFLESFKQPIPRTTTTGPGALSEDVRTPEAPSKTSLDKVDGKAKTFADVFAGVRQDSGDPADFVKIMRQFYDEQGIKDKKTIVFSDSLNIDLCIEYKKISDDAGFNTTFGVGTFFTNDFIHQSTGNKSTPLNIVIKLGSAGGNQAIKISDNIGKNTGHKETVEKVKRELGYVEREWKGGDEGSRWGKDGEPLKN
ncbi:putative nicotinate phosphoribosyltransferase [Lachnellula willkommii]|uniref:nicotinate phosphoribosyltransferase n=1 Tax=Lachnellula willkommii TaxID=215461 RepID=A0A559MFL2_9HELO|nr:putative nicotinate phosphoribosyltransferase [Lachnellula willkommii]